MCQVSIHNFSVVSSGGLPGVTAREVGSAMARSAGMRICLPETGFRARPCMIASERPGAKEPRYDRDAVGRKGAGEDPTFVKLETPLTGHCGERAPSNSCASFSCLPASKVYCIRARVRRFHAILSGLLSDTSRFVSSSFKGLN
jgi:hypothetical protein